MCDECGLLVNICGLSLDLPFMAGLGTSTMVTAEVMLVTGRNTMGGT